MALHLAPDALSMRAPRGHRTQAHACQIATVPGVTGRLGEDSHGTWPLSTASSSSFRKDRSATRTRADVRVVLAGLSAHLAAELRADEVEVERTGTQAETVRARRRGPAPR